MKKKVIDKKEINLYIDAKTALSMAIATGLDIVLPTLHRWIVNHPDLGFQPAGNDGKWHINREKFQKFIHYDNGKKIFITIDEALEISKNAGIPTDRARMISWLKKFNHRNPLNPISIQFQCETSGQWWVFKNLFEEFIHAKNNVN